MVETEVKNIDAAAEGVASLSVNEKKNEAVPVPKNELDDQKEVSQVEEASADIDTSVKHPLERKWTLWYTKPSIAKSTSDWHSQVTPILLIETVEDFWGMYNNLPSASQLVAKSDFHLFREGVYPEWEDEQNANGGRWMYQSPAGRSKHVGTLWRDLMLAAIGEYLDPEEKDEIMGVVCNAKGKFFRLSIWTRTGENEDMLKKIGESMKEALGLPTDENVEFTKHNDSAKGGSRSKVKLSV